MIFRSQEEKLAVVAANPTGKPLGVVLFNPGLFFTNLAYEAANGGKDNLIGMYPYEDSTKKAWNPTKLNYIILQHSKIAEVFEVILDKPEVPQNAFVMTYLCKFNLAKETFKLPEEVYLEVDSRDCTYFPGIELSDLMQQFSQIRARLKD